MTILKRTKIIATLGPSTQGEVMLEKMIKAGMDLVRINFSHGSREDRLNQINQVRACAARLGVEVGVLADLQGPKIRISRFEQGSVNLVEGEVFILDADLSKDKGDARQVGIDYPQLTKDVRPQDTLLLDDGRIVLVVDKIEGPRVVCTVQVGGALSNNKGINRLGGGLSADALTDKDRVDIQEAVAIGADYIAISFPRSADDICLARQLITQANGQVSIVAKIERAEAIDALDDIIKASDAVMVARGDLGVEIGDAELPAVQKHIIKRARALDKSVITATQMMESMIYNSIPTRAEVFDVANAVLDGTDAVMLSAETATGQHPDKVIEAMTRICLGAEKQAHTRISGHRVECQFKRVDEAIAMAVMYTANHFDIKAIIALTESGSTPLWMSRIRSGIPIYALSRQIKTQRRMTLYRGVYPVPFDVPGLPDMKLELLNQLAVAELERRSIIRKGDRVILTRGDLIGVHGRTNAMQIIEV
jgi:pyruvate kinase